MILIELTDRLAEATSFVLMGILLPAVSLVIAPVVLAAAWILGGFVGLYEGLKEKWHDNQA